MIDKKKILLSVSVVVVAFFSIAWYDADQSSVAIDRFVGNQYTPWDTERMVKHSDAIIYGTVMSTEPVERDEVEYADDTDMVEKVRKMPYQILNIKIEESIKGGLSGTVQVRDNLDAIVREDGQKIHVRYAHSVSYEGGESGIFFIEKIDGEYVMDGHYGFLKEQEDEQIKSGFLGDSTPADIEKAIRDLARQ